MEFGVFLQLLIAELKQELLFLKSYLLWDKLYLSKCDDLKMIVCNKIYYFHKKHGGSINICFFTFLLFVFCLAWSTYDVRILEEISGLHKMIMFLVFKSSGKTVLTSSKIIRTQFYKCIFSENKLNSQKNNISTH